MTPFRIDSFRAQPVLAADVPALQRFFDRNPEYFMAVSGQPAGPDEAQTEFDDLPPAHMTFGGRALLQFLDADGQIVGMASVLTDFIAAGVGHIGLFIVASALHGRGVAQTLYRGLEGWMAEQGTEWIRLGAVAGNDKAERFWRRHGYVEVRQRTGIEMGLRTNRLFVFVKPLTGRAIDEYLEQVPRDRPGSTLP